MCACTLAATAAFSQAKMHGETPVQVQLQVQISKGKVVGGKLRRLMDMVAETASESVSLRLVHVAVACWPMVGTDVQLSQPALSFWIR
jgi:hypothetical protein